MKSFIKLSKLKLLVILLVILCGNLKAQLIVTPATGLSPHQIVQNTLVGTGVTVTNVQYCGSLGSIIYNNIGSFTTGGTPTNLGLNSGLIMASGGVTGAVGPNNSSGFYIPVSPTTPDMSDPTLLSIVGSSVNSLHDAAILEFDFVPMSDTIKFRYVFGSDEYPEFVPSFNDVFAFFITGLNPTGPAYVNKNIALLPNSNTYVSIYNVNNGSSNSGPCVNCQYYINNTGGSTIQADGLTTVLTAWARVVPCTQYHLKLVIADANDRILDSWVWLEANSFTSTAVSTLINFSNPNAIPMAIGGCNNEIIKFKLPFYRADTAWVVIDTIYGSAHMGQDYLYFPDSIPIYPGTLSSQIVITPIANYGTSGTVKNIILKIKTNSCGVDSLNIPIMNYSPLHVTTGNDTMICQNANNDYSAFLHSHPSGGKTGSYYYSWYPTTYLNNPNLQNPNSNPNSPSNTGITTYNLNYMVTLTDTTGCPGDTSSMVITVNQQPQMSFSTNPTQPDGCAPINVSFINSVDPAAKYTHWFFGDGTSDTAQNPTHLYNIPGSFGVKLIATTFGGCTDSLYLPNIINVHAMPNPDFTWTPHTGVINYPVYFTNKTIPVNSGFSYTWDFGDNTSIASDKNPAHSYLNTGTYSVLMVCTSDYGCIDSIRYQLMVINDSLTFPNIITPNGDGLNDFFVIKGLTSDAYPNNQLVIYNRWGKVVYESNNYQNNFDGKGLPDGVYFYIFKARGILKEIEHKGSLEILR